MKCFNYFKCRAGSPSHKSEPELTSTSTTDNSGAADSAHDDVHNKSADPTNGDGITDLSQDKLAHHLRAFTFSELRIATNDFNRLLKIGEGGFGSVYKGRIKPLNTQHHPIFVAVKKLDQDGSQGHKQWLAEVQFLKVVQHPNLVKLIGYCALDEKKDMQLMYEYMPNKSLADHLFRKSYPPLPWEKRLHIMLGAAQGLAYLHEPLQVQVIFRDFKTSNILLDENFEAKRSDFGLAREGPTPRHTHVSTAAS